MFYFYDIIICNEKIGGGSMHDKLKILLDKIELDDNMYSYFNEGRLEKVILNKEMKKTCFVLSLENTLPINVYDMLSTKIVPVFKNESFETIALKINCKNINY